MLNATADAPVRATKDRARQKAAPSPTFAGARPHCDRPTPPIHRAEEDAEHQGPCKLTRSQLVMVLEVAAGNLATLDQLLMQAQEEKDSICISVLIDAAQAIVSHCGGMVDTAAGAAIIGNHDRWNFGPNFAKASKVGAA